MRELVEQIDAHVEPDDTEATSIPSTQDQLSVDPLFSVADQQQTEAADQTRPSAWSTCRTIFLQFFFYCIFIISYYLFGKFAYVIGMWWLNS